jgi:glycerol-1-phosphate dehydrogenase [NAD(P)+]
MAPKGLGVSSDALHGEKVGVGTLLALAEYEKISCRSDLQFRDYEEYAEAFLLKAFDPEMYQEIAKENEKDAAAGITAQTLRDNWAAVVACLKELPALEELRNLYAKLSVKSTLSDIGVDNDKAEELLRYSPTVRNRLTLMRLRKCW